MTTAWLAWIVLMLALYLNIERLPKWFTWPALAAALGAQFFLVSEL